MFSTFLALVYRTTLFPDNKSYNAQRRASRKSTLAEKI